MHEEVIDLFSKIDKPNKSSLTVFLKIASQLADARSLELGEKVVDTMSIELRNDVFILNLFLEMFIKCGDMLSAEQLFIRMKKIFSPTVSS